MDNVKSVLLHGKNLEFVLFKNAFNFAENGHNVWFISREPFRKFPQGVDPPDKDVLKQLTFLYVKDCEELLRCINGIQVWHKVPELIILNEFHSYTESSTLNEAAHLVATLLDATAACGRKLSKTTYLLVASANDTVGSNSRLQAFVDLYFDEVVGIDDKNVDYILGC